MDSNPGILTSEPEFLNSVLADGDEMRMTAR